MSEYTDYQDLTLSGALECLRRRDETIAGLRRELSDTAREMRECATEALTQMAHATELGEQVEQARKWTVALEGQLAQVVNLVVSDAREAASLHRSARHSDTTDYGRAIARSNHDNAAFLAVRVLLAAGVVEDADEAEKTLWGAA